jgi:hypothetical protein
MSFLLAASAGHAGAIDIEFDLTGSVVNTLGGRVTVPPDGTITAGTVRMRVPGAGAGTASAGPSRLSAFSMGLSVDALVSGASVAGTAMMAQNGIASGTLTGMLTHLAVTSPLLVSATGSFQCNGAGCAALGTFPVSFNGLQTVGPPVNFTVNGLGASGQATARGTLLMRLGTRTAVLDVVGSEISRTFVPEPGWAWHAALLLGSAVVFARLRR